jgi:HEAT repeat protein
MRTSFLISYRRVIASLLVGILLLVCQPTAQSTRPIEDTGPADKIDSLISQLRAPGGKVEHLFTINPGGPVFEASAPMKKLIAAGNAIQPRLLEALRDPQVRNEVALILAETGDKDALPQLIEHLPTKKELTRDEHFSAMCLLYALWQLTGIELGIHHKFSPRYSPEFRERWRAWYEWSKDCLYSPSEPQLAAYGRRRERVLVDLEALFAGQLTAAYRKAHPWIAYEEVKAWRDGPAYEHKLKDFCFSLILNLTRHPYPYGSREAIRSLGLLRDARALSALHAMCAMAKEDLASHALVATLEERGDPSSIPFLKKIPLSRGRTPESDPGAPGRLGSIQLIRLLQKYSKELKGKPFDAEEQADFMRCLESPRGVERLIGILRNREYDCFLPRYLLVAGYVDREPMRSCLKRMAGDGSRDERSRTLVHGALARLGEADSLGHLERSLAHKLPGVQLAAAECLWRLGRRDGFQTLVGILDLRPIESGGEGVEVGDGTLTVTALRGANVEYVRSACQILGEMGDRSAIGPLKRLLPLNLNGVLAGGGSGTGWPGRPDAVALAKLGDFSGIRVLRASIRAGDPLGVAGSWLGPGDFAAIGLKRFIPEQLPLLKDRDETKRVVAAKEILLLLERGR